MDLHYSRNVRRVLRGLAAQWGCPVWKAEHIIQQNIDRSWEKAMLDSEAKALWDKFFPDGKPSSEQYILRLGIAHENGEDVPYLLQEEV